jgi:cytochrome c
MRLTWTTLAVACIAVAACGKQPTESPAASRAPAEPQAPAPAAVAPEPAPAAAPGPAPANGAPALSTNGLELARKSGCLACHSIEKKLVGPAWKDVAARYRNDAGARAALIEKVKKGGKGNWTEVTGGTPMPPYSPRVSDADIEALVDFVLAL